MTREEIEAKYADQLRGLLARAFAENHFAERGQSPGAVEAAKGKFILDLFRDGQAFLKRVLDDAIPKPKAAANGQLTQVRTP